MPIVHRHNIALLLLVSSGCVASRPSIETTPGLPSTESPTPSSAHPVSRTLEFQPDTASYGYTSSMTTIIELTGPGTPVTDSILLTADYTIAATSPSAPRIKGTVNRISVQRGSRTTSATPDSLSFPFTFTGSIAGSLFQLDSVGGQPLVLPLTCINHTLAALTPLHQLFTILPSTIPAGGIWTDSSTIPVCSGSIPAKLTVIRTFRILGESRYEGQGALVLERVARSRLAGTGSQGQHHVTLDTQGSGSDTLRVSTVTGVLLASSGDHTARVAITSSGRTQEFQQRVRQRTLRVLGQ